MYIRWFGAKSLLEIKDKTTFIDFKVWSVYTTYAVKEITYIIIIDAMHKFPTIATKHIQTTCFAMIQNEDDDDDDVSIREGTKCNSNTSS